MIEHNSISHREKSMAALALYGDLYNRNMGIKDILSEFIRMVFAIDPSHNLSESDVALLLKREFGFIVPLSVLANILKNDTFLKYNRSERNYRLENTETNAMYISDCQNNLNIHDENTQEVFLWFINFVERVSGNSLNEEQKKSARTALYSYLVSRRKDEVLGEYVESFILSCKKEPTILERLQKVQNGIILFEGVCYDAGNPQEVSRFIQRPLKVYLDTEILFNAVGYNGELFKELFHEFYDAV